MNIFEYSDYRAYLRDFYNLQKKKSRSYSFRVFANCARLNSPNYLKLVIDGARRVTDKNLPNFIRGLSLNPIEANYFRNLVLFQETEDSDARSVYQLELARLQVQFKKKAKTIEAYRREILRHWCHFVIREMVLLKDFRNDPHWVSKKLKGKITPAQAQESLEILERLEFIKQKENGTYIQTEPLITTTDEVSSKMLRRLHRQFMELGIESLQSDPIQEREFSGLTLALPKSAVSKLKQIIKEFRKDLNRTFSDLKDNEEVYYLSVNLYPVTHFKEEKERGVS